MSYLGYFLSAILTILAQTNKGDKEYEIRQIFKSI